jgi:hypothetical protein
VIRPPSSSKTVTRETNLASAVLKTAQRGASERGVLLVAHAHSKSIFRKRHIFLRSASHVLGDLQLDPGFCCEVPGSGGRCRERLTREFVIGLHGDGGFLRGISAVAKSAPEIRLPCHADRDALQRGGDVAAAAHLETARAEDSHSGT